MSRLAAVRTGQPTQGLGTVPNGKRPPAVIDDLEPPASINPRSAHSAAAATVTAAWLSLTATELEVRKYFKSIPVPSGLEALAKMRHQCDLAAETLQSRMDESNTERCTGCGKTLEEVRKTQFLMQGSDVDPETGVPMPYRFCSSMCVRERNREKMLPPDQRNKLRFDGQPEGDIR
jgi:hypothetical protein